MTTKNNNAFMRKLTSLYSDAEYNVNKIDASVIAKTGKDLYGSATVIAGKAIDDVIAIKQSMELSYGKKRRRLRRKILVYKLIFMALILYVLFYFFIKSFGEIKNIIGS